MSSSSAPSKRSRARGWWRLCAGVLFVAAGTLALGYYLPLRQSHAMLTAQFTSAKTTQGQLGTALEQVQAELVQVQAERAELSAFKAEVDAERSRYVDAAARFAESAKAPLKTALDNQRLELRPANAGLVVTWRDPGLLTRNRNALTRSGQGVLCPQVSSAAALGLGQLAVHTFAPASSASPEVDMAQATTLALSVAERLRRLCAVAPEQITLTTSLVPGEPPLLELALLQAAPAPRQ